MTGTIVYNPLPYQELFHEARKPNAYLSAGYGAGKTHSLCMKAFALMNENMGLPGGILCPTLKMFKRDVLPNFREICDDNQIIMGFHKTDNVFEFPQTGSIIYVFHSEDDGHSIRGPNLAFGLINEVTLVTKAAFDAFLARVRLKKAKLRQVAMSGTPEGFGWTYEYFIEKPRDDTDLIFGDMRLNTHIAEDYAKRLMESYDEKMIEQYVGGKFVNLTGNRAAWAFDRQTHVKPCTRDPELPIWISCDFNVYPMTATIWQRCGARDNVWLRALDEVYINASADTWELADTIWHQLGGKEKQDCEIVIFPDPAGQARSTKSRHLTDIDILKQSGFKDIRFRSRIKSVRDCLNALNNLLSKGRIVIDPKCKNLIADLERCILKSGGLEIDKSDGKRGHLLDGVKNMAEYEFGIKNDDVRAREFRIR